MLLKESFYDDVQILQESDESGQKQWYIEGIFAQANVVNRNKRHYSLDIMESEVRNYQNLIEQKRSVGELNHPDNQTINMERITHIVEEIRQEGSNFIGKARILNTPAGNIVKGLLEGGVKLGVSTRGTGTIRRDSNGISEVQSDFKLNAIDIVFHPSAPDAMVNALHENEELTISDEDIRLVESIQEEMTQQITVNEQEEKIKSIKHFCDSIGKKYAK